MSDDLVSRLRAPSFTVPAELSAQDKLMALIRGLEALCAESAAEIERQNKRLDLLAVGFGVPDGGRYIADWQTRIKKYQDQAAEIDRLREQVFELAHGVEDQMEEAAYHAKQRAAAESELSTLRARVRVREVVGPFAEMRQALELISANKPGDELLDDRAIFQTWGLKDTPTSKQITLGHLRAARQLMGDLK